MGGGGGGLWVCPQNLEMRCLVTGLSQICGHTGICTVGKLQDPAAASLIFVSVAALGAEGC